MEIVMETERQRLIRTFAYERVRFHHDPEHTYLCVNVTEDCLLELTEMAGQFAPSLFQRVSMPRKELRDDG